MKRVLSFLSLLSLAAACGDPPIEEGAYICSVDLVPETYGYVVEDDVLTVFKAGVDNSEKVLTREGEGDGVFGTWRGMDFDDNGIMASKLYTFSEDKVTVAATCQRDSDDPVEVSVTARALITDSTIQFLDEKHAWEKF